MAKEKPYKIKDNVVIEGNLEVHGSLSIIVDKKTGFELKVNQEGVFIRDKKGIIKYVVTPDE